METRERNAEWSGVVMGDSPCCAHACIRIHMRLRVHIWEGVCFLAFYIDTPRHARLSSQHDATFT